MKPKQSEADRFWARVEKVGGGCWNWLGKKSIPASNIPRGYFHRHGYDWPAHRVAWILTHGPIKRNLCVLHSCDNSMCCNPQHLFLGTHGDNSRDMVRKGRQAKRLSDQQIKEIRKLASAKIPRKEIAARFNINPSYVGEIVRRRYRKYVK